MSNTLTISAFAENLFAAKDIVARELTGFIPSVLINSAEDGVSINGTVTSLVTAQPTLNTSVTPAMTIPDGDDQTISALTTSIGQVANVRIPMAGEIWRKLNNTAGSKNALDALFAQAMRVIVNAIESHCGTVIKNGSSRAIGTAGTTPFASTHAVIPQVHQILKDNGCPEDGQLSLVINTAAGTAFRTLSNIYKANEAGSDVLLRKGTLLDIDGVMIKESAGVASHTKGSGTGYLINLGNVAIGSTALTLDTGSGTIVAGDVLTHASDSTNKYIVGTALAANVVTLNNPGLRIATANNDAVTVGNNYTANMAFHRNAVELIVRPPALPEGGDAAIDSLTISDSKTGLVFQVSIYGGYKMQMLDITTYYQAKVWKPEFVATLLG
ncbi:MAG: P22 coat - protein 5 family protein [Caulobacteraceae bacterium]|nr:P22 coat - protein 5 family protein [Caulobacteraceae bacterium]